MKIPTHRPRLKRPRNWVVGLAALGSLAGTGPAVADDANFLELAVKATYLSKLQPFIHWPDDAFSSPTSPFNLCVIGNHPFGELLDKAVAGQQFGTHAVIVLHAPAASPDLHCQMVYLAASGPQSVAAGLDAMQGTPVLTVTDEVPDGSPKGIINFVIRDNHVRFEIDAAAAQRNRLDISSKLLNIAVSVIPKS